MGRISANSKRTPIGPFAAHIGNQLHKLRQRERMTLRELHDITGMAVAFLCNLENGQHEPGAWALYQLASTFDVTVDYFFEGFDANRAKPTTTNTKGQG